MKFHSKRKMVVEEEIVTDTDGGEQGEKILKKLADDDVSSSSSSSKVEVAPSSSMSKNVVVPTSTNKSSFLGTKKTFGSLTKKTSLVGLVKVKKSNEEEKNCENVAVAKGGGNALTLLGAYSDSENSD